MGQKEIDDVVNTLYEAVSFAAGGHPDWEMLRSLFMEEAQLIRAGWPEADERVLSIDRFVKLSASHLRSSPLRDLGFQETETMRRTERYGKIAHVFSSYEARSGDDAQSLLARGSNSIQLIQDGTRWWISSLLWDEQRIDQAPTPPS